jgi:exopolyphosphatase/guanosine-5'-triphosphate,3'-diphosphate pyrophosphatase
VAAIDCGTNSTRLLILDHDGQVRRRDNIITRLGDQLDRSGRLSPDAQQRVLGALTVFAQRIADDGVERHRTVATAAVRSASNGEAFVDAMRRVVGNDVDVISGDEEARLSFVGARSALPDVIVDDVVVFDIGGGSTECVRHIGGELVTVSLPIGVVRFDERWGNRLEEGRAAVRELLVSTLGLDERWAPASPRAVALAGTMATLVHLELGADDPDPRYPGWRDSPAVVTRWRERLATASHDERAALRGMRPGREDLMAGGLVIMEEVCRYFNVVELVAGEADILDGVALELRSN